MRIKPATVPLASPSNSAANSKKVSMLESLFGFIGKYDTALQIASAVLLGLTALVGAFSLAASRQADKRRDAEIATSHARALEATARSDEANARAEGANAGVALARLETAKASESAAEANARAEEAGKGAEEVRLEAAKANERARALEVEAEEARKENLLLQTEVLKLKNRMASRRVSADAKISLIHELVGLNRSHPNTERVEAALYTFPVGDPEIEAFSVQLRDMLVSAGWNATLTGVGSTDNAPAPCVVHLGDGANLMTIASAEALVRWLKSDGIDVRKDVGGVAFPGHAMILGDRNPSAKLSIIIGKK